MIVAVDIGNSNIVIGGIRGSDILFEARLRTDATKTSDEYAIDLKMIFEIHRLEIEQIEGSIIASVVPQAELRQNRVAKAYRKRQPCGWARRENEAEHQGRKSCSDRRGFGCGLCWCAFASQAASDCCRYEHCDHDGCTGCFWSLYRRLYLPWCENFPGGAHGPHSTFAGIAVGSAQARDWA